MIRLLALSTTALVALAALPAAAQNIVETADGAVVDVLGPDVIDVNGVAVTIEGDFSELNNDGLIISVDDDAVDATGDDFTLNNSVSGIIEGADRGVRIRGDDSTVNNDGLILATGDDAVDANVDGFELYNNGIISTDPVTGGRGVQARGDGTYIENNGVILARDETIEARENFELFNGEFGAIINTGEEDAVQFATGVVENYGEIVGGDDGIDFDDGVIRNYGLIESVSTDSEAAGIDIDEIIENADGSTAPALLVEIHNEGEIKGYTGIGADPAATSDVIVTNEGLIEGTGLNAEDRIVAMQFAPMQGVIDVSLEGDSEVIGDIVFGGSDDFLRLEETTTDGDILGGWTAFGGDGFDTLEGLDSVLTRDLRRVGDVYTAFLMTVFGTEASISFTEFEFVEFGNAAFDEAALAAVAPVPLPAAGWLLLAGLGGLVALRRRA